MEAIAMSAGPTNRHSIIMNDTPLRTPVTRPLHRPGATQVHGCAPCARDRLSARTFCSFHFISCSFLFHLTSISPSNVQGSAQMVFSNCLQTCPHPVASSAPGLKSHVFRASRGPDFSVPLPLAWSYHPQIRCSQACGSLLRQHRQELFLPLLSHSEALRPYSLLNKACSLWISACARSTCEAQRLLGRDARLEPLRPPGRKGRRGGASRGAQRAAKGFRCRAAKGFLEATVLAALATVEAPLLRPFATLELTWCFSSRSLALA